MRRDGKGKAPSGSFSHLAETAMPNPYRCLPSEILDHIIDLLHDEFGTLKQCCLVSKSWVPRTRKHLFADIEFRFASDLGSWKKTFPDAATSPAFHARTLLAGCPRLITPSDGGEGGWIRAFSGVRSLDVDGGDDFLRASEICLTPFRQLSPTLKSLRIGPILVPFPGLFDFILSFPLLEDLGLKGRDDMWFDGDDTHGPQTVIPSTSPPLTGSLEFHILGGAEDIARQLLELPNGLHFRELVLTWDHPTDLWWITELVERCSHTLESLDVTCTFRRTFIHICVRTDNLTMSLVGCVPGSFDLSNATRLRDLVLRPGSQAVGWITTALQTIPPQHRGLRQISIYVAYYLTTFGAEVGQFLGEGTLRQWLDLDRLLVQFWESHSIRPRVGSVRLGQNPQKMEDCIRCLFPEITKRGIIDGSHIQSAQR